MMPEGPQRRYTDEFKTEAVRLVRESARPVAQVARELGIPDNVLYCWRLKHRQTEAQGTSHGALRDDAEELAGVKTEVSAGHPGAGFFTTCGGVLRYHFAAEYEVRTAVA